MLIRKRKKYYAIFLVGEAGSYSRVAKRRFRPTQEKIRYRKGSYIVDVSIPSYTRGLKLFYFYEKGKNTHLNFGKNTNTISPKVIDLILSQKIVSELTSNLGGSMKMQIMTLIIGALMGGFLGFIIAGYV